MNQLQTLMEKVHARVKVPLLLYFQEQKKKFIYKTMGLFFTYAALFTFAITYIDPQKSLIQKLIVILSFLILLGSSLPLTLFSIFDYQYYWGKYKEILNNKSASLKSMLGGTDYTSLVASLQKLEQQEIEELFNIPLNEEQLNYISDCITTKGTITHDDLYALHQQYITENIKEINFNAFAGDYNLHDIVKNNTQQNNIVALAKLAVPTMQHTQTFNSRNTL